MKRSVRLGTDAASHSPKKRKQAGAEQPELLQDCFLVVLSFLSPWEKASVLVVNKTWCSWLRASRTWGSVPTANPRGVCAVHRTRKAAFCRDLKCFLCSACVRTYTKGFLTQTSARCRFGLSAAEADALLPSQERLWSNGWESTKWYLKKDVARLSVTLHGGLLHIGNGTRKRRVCLLLNALKQSLHRKEWSVSGVLSEAGATLRSACRTFLSPEHAMPERDEGPFVQAFAEKFCAERRSQRASQLRLQGEAEPGKWEGVLKKPLFQALVASWLRSEDSIRDLDALVGSVCTSLLQASFQREGFCVPWKELWKETRTQECLLRGLRSLRAAGDSQCAAAVCLAETRGVWLGLKRAEYARVRQREAKCVLRAAEVLGVKKQFFSGRFRAREYGAQSVAAVREFLLVLLETSFFPAHKLTRRTFGFARGVRLAVQAFIDKMDVSDEATAAFLVHLEKEWARERREALRRLETTDPVLFSKCFSLGLESVFLQEFMTKGDLQRRIELEMMAGFEIPSL